MFFQNTLNFMFRNPKTPMWMEKCKTTGSLQAQASVRWKRKIKRASCFASCKGSATVEAAMILPLFLCAVCTLFIMGQMLLVEGEVQHSVVKTAAICAKQETAAGLAGIKSSLPETFLEPTAAFYSVFQAEDLCSGCILGGSHGIAVSMDKSYDQGNRIKITARYSLKIPVPFFRGFYAVRKATAVKRLYTGYLLHKGEIDPEDSIVYLAEHGLVYHTSLSCSHISLRISGNAFARSMLEARGIRPCEKCMKAGRLPEAFYVTAEGDCYHASVSCSGLKRTVRAVRLSEIKGMRLCARCAIRAGKRTGG